jgi:hypothetical protein
MGQRSEFTLDNMCHHLTLQAVNSTIKPVRRFCFYGGRP